MATEETMVATFTPGPWDVAPYSDTDERVDIVKDYKKVPGGSQAHWIAECDSSVDYEMSDGERKAAVAENIANAHLIAAAPELYAALSLAESVYRQNVVAPGEPSSVLDAMRAALAKAEGKS